MTDTRTDDGTADGDSPTDPPAIDAPATDGAPDVAAGAADRVCETCGRAFHTEELLVLHRGVRHPAALDEAEREAYREAYAAEERAIRSFRLRALAALVLLYFGFLFLYVIYAS